MERVDLHLTCHSCNLNSVETPFEWNWPIDPLDDFDMGTQEQIQIEEEYDDSKCYEPIW